MLSVRPKVAELTFQLYGRSLHPELFQIFKTAKIERGGYAARVDITSAGHIVTWRYGGLTLTEVAASAQHPLPQKRALDVVQAKRRAARPSRVSRWGHLPGRFSIGDGFAGSILAFSAGANARRRTRRIALSIRSQWSVDVSER